MADQAIVKAREALDISDDVRVRRVLALALARTGKYEDARPELEKVAAVLPQDADVLLALGTAYANQNDLPGAERALRAAVGAKSDERSITALSTVMLRQRKPNDVLELLGPLVQKGTAGPFTTMNAGYAAEMIGNKELARSIFTRVLDFVERNSKQLDKDAAASLQRDANAAIQRLGPPPEAPPPAAPK